MNSNDEPDRRVFWADQMEQGYQLVQQIIEFEVHECSEGFGSLPQAMRESGAEVLFSETKIAGELDRVFFLRQSLVEDIVSIALEMNRRGWILKIEDGYRSLDMQRQLGSKPQLFDMILRKCIWENGGTIPSVEQIFRRGCVLVANVPKAGTHLSGTAVDVSVFRRDDRSEVWRGNSYLEMSERTPMRSPFVEPDAMRNRLQITEIMEARGFMHYPFEFWHYNKDDALSQILNGRPEPARFGPVHWDPQTNTVKSVDQPEMPLRPLPELEKEITAAIERAKQLP